MTGSALKLPGALASSPFGKVQPYEGVWDSTVYLWDAGIAPLAAVPANGAVLPNLMRDRAAGASGLAVADCDIEIVNALANGFAAGEITGHGALHIASTQAGAQNATSNCSFHLSTAFANWLLANIDAGADYAVALTIWKRVTRNYVTPNVAAQSWGHIAVSTGVHLFQTTGGGAFAGVPIGVGQDAYLADVPAVLFVASQGWLGAKPANLSPAHQRTLGNVGAGPAWASYNYNKAASGILYRLQLDLVNLSEIEGTVAQKAATMLAAQNAMLARDFAAGGRFHDDTFTPAATLKP